MCRGVSLGVEGNCTLVPGGSTAPNLLEPPQTDSTEKEMCVEVFHMGSGVVQLVVVEPQGTSVQIHLVPSCEDVVREGSV